MKKIVVKFGLLSGALSIVTMLSAIPLIESVGYRIAELVGYTSMVLTALILFFGVRSYREEVGGGRLGFGRGLAVGLSIALVASLCYVAAFQIYYYLNPGIAATYERCMIERVREAGADEAEIAATAEQARTIRRLYERPLTNVALSFIETFPIGLLAAVASAGILRRRGTGTSGRSDSSHPPLGDPK